MIINYTLKDNQNTYIINPIYVRRFFLVEDIEQMYITAEMEFEDKQGWVEKLPITGNEIFEVELIQETESANIQKTISFEVYDIKMKTGTTGRVNIYTISLVEKGFFQLLDIHYSKSYSNKKISEIMTDVLKNQLKNSKYEVEETIDKINFIIPYWKPTTTIKYLSKIAKRSKTPQEAGFVFYSTLSDDKKKEPIKKFTSFGTLLEQKPKIEAKDKYYLRDGGKPVTFINNILEIKNLSMCNRKALKNGIQGKTFLGIDFHNDKNIINHSVKLSDYVKNATFLGETINFAQNIESTKADVQFKGYPNSALIKNELEHDFRMNFEDINVREILCKGVLTRYAGQMISIAEISGDNADIINQVYSGTWLIKKIVHYWIANSYEHKMTIIKNASGATTKSLMRTKKKNV